jgi:hypothetical protein
MSRLGTLEVSAGYDFSHGNDYSTETANVRTGISLDPACRQ